MALDVHPRGPQQLQDERGMGLLPNDVECEVALRREVWMDDLYMGCMGESVGIIVRGWISMLDRLMLWRVASRG